VFAASVVAKTFCDGDSETQNGAALALTLTGASAEGASATLVAADGTRYLLAMQASDGATSANESSADVVLDGALLAGLSAGEYMLEVERLADGAKVSLGPALQLLATPTLSAPSYGGCRSGTDPVTLTLTGSGLLGAKYYVRQNGSEVALVTRARGSRPLVGSSRMSSFGR
jgi:hypothetical protein